MAKVRQVGLFSRKIIEHLSPSGFEALLSGAERISEGQVSLAGLYDGSTMFTIDLGAGSSKIREACNAATAGRLATLLKRERKLQKRVVALALQEARNIARQTILDPDTDLRIRLEGTRVLMDVDVEGEVAALPERARGR